jgi:hypothetical protein
MPFICEHLPVKDWRAPIIAWEPWQRLAVIIKDALQTGSGKVSVKLCPDCALAVQRAIAAHPAPKNLTPFFEHKNDQT